MQRKIIILVTIVVGSVIGIFQSISAEKTGETDRAIAITFDDLPAVRGNLKQIENLTDRLLNSLASKNIPVTGFVVGNKLYQDENTKRRVALLNKWLDAGFDLANHTYTHCDANNTPVDEYFADILRCEEILKPILESKGRGLKYFRHPMLHTGSDIEYKTALDSLIINSGYETAPVTMDNDEFVFDFVYTKAKRRNDKEAMNRIANTYLDYMETNITFFEDLSKETLCSEINQILLLHANEINADNFDELYSRIEKRGYRFISLDEALIDPAYQRKEAVSKRGLSWIHRWRLAEGLEMKWEPDPPDFIMDMYNEFRGQ